MPELGALRDLLRTARRWALCREEECEPGDLQPFRIVVRPAIVEIIGPQWLQRLDQHNLHDDIEGDFDADADADVDVEVQLENDIGAVADSDAGAVESGDGPDTTAPLQDVTDGDTHVPA